MVARSTFGSQNVQTTPCLEHFWTLRCRKIARHFGAKHIWKSKCTNPTSIGALLEVVMSKKRTLGRREFPSQNAQSTPTSDHFWKLRCRKSARRCGAKHIWKHIWKSKCILPQSTTPASEHFWTLRSRKSARRCGAKHIWKSKCTNHTRVRALLDVEMSKNCTPLWREAHLEVKMCKPHQRRRIFGR